MTDWSSDWIPAAREALNALRGSNVEDANGLSVPALSVVDSTAVLAKLTGNVLMQLDRLRDGSNGPAALSTLVDSEGVTHWPYAGPMGSSPLNSGDGYVEADKLFLSGREYLAAYPPPPNDDGTMAAQPWFRSRHDYRTATAVDSSVAAAAWADALAGNLVEATVGIYTVYSPEKHDESGQLFEHHELVAAYQRACDAIGAGALTRPDMAQPMANDTMLAFWSALIQVAASLDTLQDVPPRPPTRQVLVEAMDTAAQFIGDAVATAANAAGEVIHQTAKGFFEGLGVYGVAAIVGVLAIYLAVH